MSNEVCLQCLYFIGTFLCIFTNFVAVAKLVSCVVGVWSQAMSLLSGLGIFE